MPTAFDLQGKAADVRTETAEDEYSRSTARIDKARAVVSTLPPGAKILDVGCSDGALLHPFVGHLDVYGVDASENRVEIAMKRGINAVVADGETLPFADSSFDAVFAGEVIEHTLSPDRFLCEINRVLRPGGSLILTVPNIRTPVGVVMLTFFGLPPMFAARYRSEHFRDFTARLIKAALKHNGFRVESFRGSAFMVPGIGSRFAWLADIFSEWADHFIIKAIKCGDARYDEQNEFRPPE